jgi:hypothetical protein
MEQEVSNIILGLSGPSDRFVLSYGIFRFNLRIKPITARQLIAISKEISQIKEVDKDNDIFPAMLEGSPDLKYISTAIAIATGTKFKKIVARTILKLDLKDIQTLFNIVRRQSDPERFFFIIAATGKMNLLKKKG